MTQGSESILTEGAATSASNDRARGLRLYLLFALAIEGVIALYLLVKHKAFSFVDVGGDTFDCFYALQVGVGKQLRTLHNVTWSFDLGLGGYLGTLFDPLWLLTAPFPDSWQLGLRLPLYLAKLLLAGGFFYGYLRVIGFQTTLAVLGALAYTFSSYGVINAQWDLVLGVDFVQFAAYLFLLEVYLRRKRPWAAVCAGIVLGLGHPMELYSFALFTIVYGCARVALITPVGLRAYLGLYARFLCWFVLGLLITGPISFPALYYFLESPRVSGEHSVLNYILHLIFTIIPRATFSSEVAGLLGKDLLGTGTYKGWGNYFEAPGFYVGILMLLCIPQLLGPSATRRERWLCIGSIGAIAMYFVFPALRFAVYGFGHGSFRLSTLWVSTLLLVLGLLGLRRILLTSVWRTGIAIGVCAVLGIVLACVTMLAKIVNYQQVIRIVGFTAAYAAILLAAIEAAWRTRMLYPLLTLFACELLVFAAPATIDRNLVNADGSSSMGRYDDGTAQAIALARGTEHNEEFYRFEKTFDSVYLDDALVQDYSGIKSYYHHASSLTRFIDRLQLPRPMQHSNWIGSATCCRAVLDLVGVKYLFTKKRSLDKDYAMTHVGSVAGIDVYRNEQAHGFGYFYDNIADEAEANAQPSSKRDVFLLDHFVVENPVAVKTTLATLDTEHSEQPSLKAQAQLRKIRDDRIEGSVQTPRAKPLLLSMPFDRGWSAQLDGSPLPLFRADYGLTGAVVQAGAHQLQLSYSPPGRVLGIWLSLGAIGLLAVLGIAARRRGSGTIDLE